MKNDTAKTLRERQVKILNRLLDGFEGDGREKLGIRTHLIMYFLRDTSADSAMAAAM